MAILGRARAFAAGAALLTLAACGGSDDNDPPPDPPDDPPVDTSIAVERAFDQLSFTAPVALLQAPGDDTRWFVVEQPGVIRVFDNDPAATTSEVFADLTARVDDGPGEAGLLGMAFDPQFSLNGEVYLSYTRTLAPLESVVSRFTVPAPGDLLDEGSEEIILTVDQHAGNHNGGHLAFGQDNLLYIGFGDGGGSGDPEENGQDRTNILGTIVRIDVDGVPPYGIPPGNPFSTNTNCVDGSGAAFCPEIYAYGFRNPWRFSFDRQTGALWVGDVGQGAFEEIDRVEVSQNYGWDEREGAHCFEPPSGCNLMNVDPITEYGRDLGRSVTGGYVYRGAAIPDLAGHYLFGDFGSGRLFSVPADSAQGTIPEERLETGLSISSFGEGVDGELYLLDYGTGTIHRIVEAG